MNAVARCRNIFKASFTEYDIHAERDYFRSALSMPSLTFDMEFGGCFFALARNNVNKEAFRTADPTRITAIILSVLALRSLFGI